MISCFNSLSGNIGGLCCPRCRSQTPTDGLRCWTAVNLRQKLVCLPHLDALQVGIMKSRAQLKKCILSRPPSSQSVAGILTRYFFCSSGGIKLNRSWSSMVSSSPSISSSSIVSSSFSCSFLLAVQRSSFHLWVHLSGWLCFWSSWGRRHLVDTLPSPCRVILQSLGAHNPNSIEEYFAIYSMSRMFLYKLDTLTLSPAHWLGLLPLH